MVKVSTIARAVGIARKAKPSGKSVTEGVHLLPHGAGITDDAARPFEHALAFRGKALETGPAVDQQNAKSFLELLHACRHGRPSYTAFRARTAPWSRISIESVLRARGA